jgi:hypothetical protein
VEVCSEVDYLGRSNSFPVLLPSGCEALVYNEPLSLPVGIYSMFDLSFLFVSLF